MAPQVTAAPIPGADYFRNRSILISGAGGTVGAELCRQLLRCKPARLVLVDRCELALYSIDLALRAEAAAHSIVICTTLDCVTRQERMQNLMRHYGVSVVLHAAAYKHVPMVEVNPIPGMENNLFGTLSLARAAVAAQVERFLLISTDKAIAPRGMLGASKYLAEQALFDLARQQTKTRCAAVRFGNVYGSSGSVIPLFQSQIAKGGPITLTDPQATRYFMSIQEAARLVLCATVLSQGGDIFALDMGQPQSILAVARRLMREAGKPDLAVTFKGLRPGERLHERSPVTPDMQATPHPQIFRRLAGSAETSDIRLLLRSLQSAISNYDEAAVRRLIEQWVFAAAAEYDAKLI